MSIFNFLFKKNKVKKDKVCNSENCICSCKKENGSKPQIDLSQNTKGVAYFGSDSKKGKPRWRAYISLYNDETKKNSMRHIGLYDTKEEAIRARLEFIENLK